jgi:hypothetical protein
MLWKQRTSAPLPEVSHSHWAINPMMGGEIRFDFFKNPDATSNIDGLLLERSDYPIPLLRILAIGHAGKSILSRKDFFSLRDPEQFPETAALLKKHFKDCWDTTFQDEIKLQLAAAIAPPENLQDAVASAVPPNTVIGTQLLHADIELLPHHAPTRQQFEKDVRREVFGMGMDGRMDHQLSTDILNDAAGESLIPKPKTKSEEYLRVIKKLKDTPLLSKDAQVRQALTQALSNFITPERVASGIII